MELTEKYLKYKNKYHIIKEKYNELLRENKNLKEKYIQSHTLTDSQTATQTATQTTHTTHTTSNNKNIVKFILNKKAGFFSMFFFMVQAYIYAKKTNKKFCINSDDWTYKYEEGWSDYFETNYECTNEESEEMNEKNIEVFSHYKMENIPNYCLKDYIENIKEIYKLKSYLIEKANKIIEKMGNYKAVYIRRGDKIAASEAKIITTSDIISNIKIDSNHKLFVQTDDYIVVKEIKKLLPNIEVISTVPENKFGSYQNDIYINIDINKGKNKNINNVEAIMNKDLLKMKEDCEELLIGVYICSKAKECWVDKTSNVSRFIKLFSPDTVHIYPNDIKLNYDKITHCPAWQESFD
jgi:hypothetical protein